MPSLIVLRKFVSPVLLLITWEACSRGGVVDPLLVPPPSLVFLDLRDLVVSGKLQDALWASMRRVVAGFLIAVLLSIVIGILMASSRLAEDLVDPLVELIRPVSPLAIFPLALLWFGIGDASKIFLIALACSFPIIINTYAGVKGIDAAVVRAARSLGASRREILVRVIVPGSLPSIFTGVRIAWGIGLIVIIASEMIGAVEGLGYMVLDAQQTFKVERVFAGIVVIGLLGFLTDQGFRWLRRRWMPWYQELKE